MSDQKLPMHVLSRNGVADLRAANGPHSALRAARARALLQEIVRIAETLGVPAVPLELLCEPARSDDPFIRSDAWTMAAVEMTVEDLSAAGWIRPEARDGEVMIRLLHPAPALPRRVFLRPPPAPPRRVGLRR